MLAKGAGEACALILDGALTYFLRRCCTSVRYWLHICDCCLILVASVTAHGALVSHYYAFIPVLCGAVYCGMCQEACPVGTFCMRRSHRCPTFLCRYACATTPLADSDKRSSSDAAPLSFLLTLLSLFRFVPCLAVFPLPIR